MGVTRPSLKVNEALRASPQRPADLQALQCFHCGEELAGQQPIYAQILGEVQPMCCAGCKAVAEFIDSGGLTQFYQQRSDWSSKPAEPEEQAAFALYDDPTFTEGFVKPNSETLLQVKLLLGHLSCAACAWLVEQVLSATDGVEAARVRLSDGSLDIVFDARKTKLSELIAKIHAIGYTVRPYVSHLQREQAREARRRLLIQMGVAGIGMMQSMMFAIGLYAGDFQGIATEHRDLLRWSSAVVATVVMWVSSRVFFANAWRHLRAGVLVMDLPVALGIGLAYIASVYATVEGSGEVYFDSVVMLTFLLLLGRYIEQWVRQRHASEYVAAEDELPLQVQIWRNDEWHHVARKTVERGDRVLVQRGAMVPLDGRIYSGNSAVDEAAFSGEHLPRKVSAGDEVYAGTVNLEDTLEMEALGSHLESRLLALQQSIDRASLERPKVTYLVDRIAGKFTATILGICAISALFWWQIDPSRVLWISMAILVVSCPCALSLATPTALTATATALRRQGILLRGDHGIVTLAGITHLLFDKTGTLTSGQLQLRTVKLEGASPESQVIAIAASLQQHSNHPVARAFIGRPAERGVSVEKTVVGAGIAGRDSQEQTLRIGSEAYCRALAPQLSEHPGGDLYWVALVRENEPLAWLGFDDPLRPEAESVVANAMAAGLRVGLLSGDSSTLASQLGQKLGIPWVRTHCSPDEKVAHIRALQAQGHRVAMVGDGLNDAPVLAAADASIAVADATALARAQADFVCSNQSLWSVLRAWQLANTGRRTIRQNIAWALGYNVIGVPAAALGFVPPLLAAIGMSVSSIIVTLNAARLSSAKREVQ